MSQPSEPTVAISLTCKRAADALDFYTKAFGAKELFRMSGPDGSVPHAEFMIGNSQIYISDESPEWHAKAMPEGSAASCLISIVTDDCDQSFARAVEAGATPLNSPQDQFWGKRSAMVRDPFGYRWSFSQHIEDVSPEEMMKRAQAVMAVSK
ncbi:MAG: VOC family protein [Verrucomicrobiae bacterium]|nr:VOC family protein [Verrucomicrobiae bacterium]